MYSKRSGLPLILFPSVVFLLFCQTVAIDESCFINPDLQRADYKECQGNKIEIYSVNISTLYNTKRHRHALFKGDNVQFCISGKATGISQPVKALQNSVHGSLRLQLGLPGLGNIVDRPIDHAFCDITLDGCADITPRCDVANGIALVPNQDFCFCSTLQVPTWSPEVDEVKVTWKILSVQSRPNSCESEFKVPELIGKGKEVLACLEMPAMVRNENKKPGRNGGRRPGRRPGK